MFPRFIFFQSVQEILKTISVPESRISINPLQLSSQSSEFIKGIVRRGEEEKNLLLILNLERISDV